MKRTMKKQLSLVLAAVMLLCSLGINVIATSECQHVVEMNNPEYQRVVNPTCTAEGYTEYFCLKCGASVQTGNYQKALGHSFGEFEIENPDEEQDSYKKVRTCQRQFVINAETGETRTCGEKEYEMNGAKEKLYQRVRFFHNKIADTYYENIKYTSVAKTYKAPVLLQTSFIENGDFAAYEGGKLYTAKTTEYGQYQHVGWTTDPSKSFSDISDEKLASALNNIQNNTDFYPVFDGVEVKYNVSFYDSENKVPFTFTTQVQHGKSAHYTVNGIEGGTRYDDPVKAEDVVNTYKFAGWVIAEDGTPISSEALDTTPIYDNVTFFSSFAPTKKTYTIEFRDEKKNLMESYDNMTLESNLYMAAPEVDELKPTKDSDETYFYTWKETWQVLRADGSLGPVVDLRNLVVSASDIIENKDPNGTVLSRKLMLVPVFERTLVRYTVDIEMGLPVGEDRDYYRGEAEVQVVANNGQLVAAGKTNADGIFRCYLNYQVPFTVNVASYEGKYLGSAVITNLTHGSENGMEVNKVLVAMQQNPDYETHCRCIHHNALLQPIIVRIYNLLYTFFKVKYVCCYDMYSTIGPLLDYVPD